MFPFSKPQLASGYYLEGTLFSDTDFAKLSWSNVRIGFTRRDREDGHKKSLQRYQQESFSGDCHGQHGVLS